MYIDIIMNTQMGSSLPSEKLDRNNFVFWEYKMHQYLVDQGYWSYIKRPQENQLGPRTPKYSTWEQVTNRVMYFLATCVHDHMLGYIREAKTPKEVWENLRKIFVANTTARKCQLHQELNNIQQRNMSITSYTLKIKELCDSLGSISVNVEDNAMVQICLGGLAPQFDGM